MKTNNNDEEDIISRKEAINYFVTNFIIRDEEGFIIDDYDERVLEWTERFNSIPSIEPKHKKGYWITVDNTKWKCSECDIIHTIYQYPHGNANFCPNCGSYNGEEEK